MAKKYVAFLIVLLIVVFSACLGILAFFYFSIASMPSFIDKPEEIFRQYVLEGKGVIPASVTQIQGLEKTHLDPLRGPVYIHFKADSSFTEQMIEKESLFYNPYAQIPCAKFFDATQRYNHIETFSEQFEWWTPTEIEKPLCYRAGKKEAHYDDEAKYLLIDTNRDEVYFLRTTTPTTSIY